MEQFGALTPFWPIFVPGNNGKRCTQGQNKAVRSTQAKKEKVRSTERMGVHPQIRFTEYDHVCGLPLESHVTLMFSDMIYAVIKNTVHSNPPSLTNQTKKITL